MEPEDFKKCPRCKAMYPKDDVCYMWDCIIDDRKEYAVAVCSSCDDELGGVDII